MFEHWWRSGHQSPMHIPNLRENRGWKFEATVLGADATVVFSCSTYAGTSVKKLGSPLEPTCGAARAELLTTTAERIAMFRLRAIRAKFVEARDKNTEKLYKEGQSPSSIHSDSKNHKHQGFRTSSDRNIAMAPSIMLVSSPVIRKQSGHADPSNSSTDPFSLPVSTKAVPATKDTNGNGVSAAKPEVSEDIITGATDLKVNASGLKTEGLQIMTEIRSFECVKHFKPAEFPKVLSTLPFPKELDAMVSWTDAFVERLGLIAMAEKQATIDRINDEKDGLYGTIQDLQHEKNGLLDVKCKLDAEICLLKSKNDSLVQHNKEDDKRIANFAKKSEKDVKAILKLTREKECLNRRVTSLSKKVDELCKKNSAGKAANKELVEMFEKWKLAEDQEDIEQEAALHKVEEELAAEKATKEKAQADLDEAVRNLKDLVDQVKQLTTMSTQLQEMLGSVRKQLSDTQKNYADSEARRQTLETLYLELTKKEEQSTIQIQSLRKQLNDAELEVKYAKDQVLNANKHSEDHWNTLNNVRIAGGWGKADKADECEKLVAKVIYSQAEQQPAVEQPVAEKATVEETTTEVEKPFH
ncbi:hypothetical protein N7520_002810 [Penicillium odoratum]|uniref:uncharacterized protein n=1 Tax=Penicillium odoratum TaxID=1167516 RepID=UPI002547B4F5|nr:uncharacterized protein N7520_002810 [Penicillium odoratum]KAJ5772281.1 hypothetical protein N7520_002810 [Penicillium odoratum]